MGVKIREKPKGSGVWWGFINHHGKRKAKKLGKDKKLANKWKKKMEARLVLNDSGFLDANPAIPTFGEYAKKWLSFIKAKRRESTYERYDQVLKDYIYPVFKKKSVNNITRGDIRDFLIAKGNGYDVGVLRDILSGVLGFAVDDELIKANPVTGVTKKLELKRTKKEVEVFNEVDLNLFLETCEKEELEFYPFFLMAARTGMRLGEILAIRWGDIDFNHKETFQDGTEDERPFIWVRRSYRRGRFTLPKNGKIGKVDMSRQLKDTLKGRLITERKRALKRGEEIPELVFYREGQPIEQKYIQRLYKRMLKKAGLGERKFHTLRHTFASILLSKGVDPFYVKEQLHHSSIDITVNLYGKYIQTKREPCVNMLDNATTCNPAATNLPKSHLST